MTNDGRANTTAVLDIVAVEDVVAGEPVDVVTDAPAGNRAT